MGYCKRSRTRADAPTNSGSKAKPERNNIRGTTEEQGRLQSNVRVALEIATARGDRNLERTMSYAIHHVMIPAFEKLVRAYLYGSSAEKEAAKVYLEERVRKEDYLRNRVERYQTHFTFA